MTTMPMFDVLPITGADQGRGPLCYVCKLGSEPVMAVFAKPETLETSGLLEAVQLLSNSYERLQAFVVCISAPDQHLENDLQALAAAKGITVPLVLLPDGKLPASLPVKPDAENTVLTYRGRQITAIQENVRFDQDFAQKLGPLSASHLGAAALHRAQMNTDAAFKQLDSTVQHMLNYL
jgi:hypothetical protein